MQFRKNLRLPEYKYSAPGAYFITVCVQNKRCILSTVMPNAPAVVADAHIGHSPAAPNPTVVADAHIGHSPEASNPAELADTNIGPATQLTKTGMVVEKYLRSIPGIGEYVIMPNHVHMMLHISAEDPRKGPMWASAPTNADISTLIRSWKTLVTKELGHSIWQRSFYDHILRDERDYWTHIQYIRENPIKWQEDDYFVR